jgi:hypothetical protein
MTDVHYEALLPWPLHEVARTLRGLPWTFPRPDGEAPHPGWFSVDLSVPIGSQGSISHRAAVELGDYEPDPDRWLLPVTISASRPFPTFRGAFEIRDVLGDSVLILDGGYRLPLGVAGRVSGGNGLARTSLRRFFEKVVETVKRDLQATASPWRPHVWPESLRDA